VWYFVHCVTRGQHPTPDVDDGIACLKVLLALEEAAQTGQPVRLEQSGRDTGRACHRT
jgi:predicted dehydrogenase